MLIIVLNSLLTLSSDSNSNILENVYIQIIRQYYLAREIVVDVRSLSVIQLMTQLAIIYVAVLLRHTAREKDLLSSTTAIYCI